MKLLKNFSVPTRKYTDRDGKEKSVWRNVANLWQDDEGHVSLSIDIFFNFSALKPSKEGSDMVFIRGFDPKPKDGNNSNNQSSSNNNYGSLNDGGFDNNGTLPDDGPIPF